MPTAPPGYLTLYVRGRASWLAQRLVRLSSLGWRCHCVWSMLGLLLWLAQCLVRLSSLGQRCHRVWSMLGGFVGMAAGIREFTLAVGPLGSVDVEPRLDRATLTGVRPGCVGTVGGCFVALPPPSPPGGRYCDITRCPRVGVAERCPNSHVTGHQGYRAHVGG